MRERTAYTRATQLPVMSFNITLELDVKALELPLLKTTLLFHIH